jgi:hypothetical protein
MHSSPRRPTRGCGFAATTSCVIMLAGLCPRPAYGQQAADTPFNAFACMGEAQAFSRRHDVADIRAERDRLLAVAPGYEEPATTVAHRLCVIAELMRVLGDDRAADFYVRAIAVFGEPGYQLRLADYLRNVRGPRAPLLEQAEKRYQAALDGVQARSLAPGVADDTITEWATRGLMLTYQQDGVPLLPWKAFPYKRSVLPWPGIALMAGARIAFDTNTTPIDLESPATVDDARRFTSEAMFAASMFRKAQPLREDELQAIARASLREETMVRARLRTHPIGAIDVWYRRGDIYHSGITNYSVPKELNDIRLSELGLGLTRALDLYPALDVLVSGNYRRIHRLGAVEFLPDQAQDFNVLEARPVIARTLGPDKLSLSGTYTFMDIPDIAGGRIEDRMRGRTIVSFNIDYALYRLLLRPFRLPAIHLFAGSAWDDETFGVRVVHQRDAYLGVKLDRIKNWDITMQASVFSGSVRVQPLDPAQPAGDDPEQSNSQYRTTLVLLRRLIDEDAQPGLPPETWGIQPSMVNAVLTVRHDARLRGLYAFQNVRAGLDVWAKAFVAYLRGAAILISAGYENQYFYSIGKDLHIFHLDLRMGW